MQPDFSTATVVLVGRFNPDAFLPDALADGKVISKKEAERVKFEMLLRGQGVQFRFSWGELFVTTDRFQIGTNEAPYVRISDFATKALNDLPTESTITQFGINLECHFNLGSIEARDALGKKLAPPQAWAAWGDTILQNMRGNAKENPVHGGMMFLQMRQPFIEEPLVGWLDVAVGPSLRIPDNAGIFFRTNHHHQFRPKESKAGSAEKQQERSATDGRILLESLASRFDDSILSAETIFAGVLAS